MSRDVEGYLTEQRNCTEKEEISAFWDEISALYNKKLWHQLTLKLLVFVRHESFNTGDGLIKMYHNFIADFEHRINPLALGQMTIFISKQIKDPQEAITFVEKIKEKVSSSMEANILCQTLIGEKRLELGQLDEAKTLVKDISEKLDQIDGITSVHGPYYAISSNYYKLCGMHKEYYEEALKYLGCIDYQELSTEEQTDRAFTLAVSAILGEGVYNFGELLAHPILQVLKGTSKGWLVDLLLSFNAGNLKKFEELKVMWSQQADLVSAERRMRQKMCLLCLMEMTFTRPSNDRQISFQEISSETGIPKIEVEFLVMKALALNLVRGSIDQVDQKISMTWVQPRVLDKNQIQKMQHRFNEWSVDVNKMQVLVEERAKDLM